jgi:hypothetical protein
MSLIAEIREQMGRESGPVHPKHLAEVLDQDIATVRNTMNQASTKGHGIERLDDGTFSLIPGWKPARGPNASAAPEEAPAAAAPGKPKRKYVRKAAAAKPVKAKRAIKVKSAPKPKRAYTRKSAGAPEAGPGRCRATFPDPGNFRGLPDDATRQVLKFPTEVVHVSRTTLALLVEGVLDGNAPITGALRTALREATSHALPF